MASLNKSRCSLHDKNLELYCEACFTPICTNCEIINHARHKVSNISDAYNSFLESTVHLRQHVEEFNVTMETRRNTILQNTTKLEKNKKRCIDDINAHVDDMENKIKETKERLIKNLDELYAKKKSASDKAMLGLEKLAVDVNSEFKLIERLIGNRFSALQTGHVAIANLNENMKALPALNELENDGELHFRPDEPLTTNKVGSIIEYQIKSFNITLNSLIVTKGETFEVKISEEGNIDRSKINLTLSKSNPTEVVTSDAEVKKKSNGDYVIVGSCSSVGLWKLDVSIGDDVISGSPLTIQVERETLVQTIDTNEMVTDVVGDNDGCLLIAYISNEILKFKLSTHQRSLINVAQGVNIHRMHRQDRSIIFSDTASKCIRICTQDGLLVNTIGKGLMTYPSGLDVNKTKNEIYIADFIKNCVFKFHLDSGCLISEIGSKGSELGQFQSPKDVAITNDGNIIVADTWNHRLQMFNTDGMFLKVLVERGFEDGKVIYPCAILIDTDENILIGSEHKVQLFNKNGIFIKRIDRDKDGIKSPQGLCIVSQNPRRLAVTNLGHGNVKIFNY